MTKRWWYCWVSPYGLPSFRLEWRADDSSGAATLPRARREGWRGWFVKIGKDRAAQQDGQDYLLWIRTDTDPNREDPS